MASNKKPFKVEYGVQFNTGPTGPTGPQGTQGVTGPTGATGPAATTLAANVVITAPLETTTVSGTGVATTYNFDVKSASVQLVTASATANWTLNVRGNASTTLNSVMSTNQTVTITFLVTTGATPYYQTGFTIDGTSTTVRWQGGTAPSSGNASSIEAYTFTITKTASATYTVIGARTRFA